MDSRQNDCYQTFRNEQRKACFFSQDGRGPGFKAGGGGRMRTPRPSHSSPVSRSSHCCDCQQEGALILTKDGWLHLHCWKLRDVQKK